MGLARHAGPSARHAVDVAARTDLAPATVVQRLRDLTAAGLFAAAPGQSEPLLTRARPPETIMLADISAVAGAQRRARAEPLSVGPMPRSPGCADCVAIE